MDLKTSAPSLPTAKDFSRFLRKATTIAAPELCPELRLHTATDLPSLWKEHESRIGRLGAAAPFWGIAWPGGQALARFVLDHGPLVAGRTVLDFGSGCGICAIAAARAGARSVEAADIDPYSRLAIGANARLNGASVTIGQTDVMAEQPRWDVVLASDVWYDRFLAERVTPWLRSLARAGTMVLLGDIGRAHFPRSGLVEHASYAIRTMQSLERDSVSVARVCEVRRNTSTASRL
jgi:predicted nicotinamide N-methyase